MIKERNKFLVRISELTGISGDEILGARRFTEIVEARSLLAWALTDLCGYTTTQVGILIRRHYSSVIYLRRKLTTASRLPLDTLAIMGDLKLLNKQLKQQQNEPK